MMVLLNNRFRVSAISLMLGFHPSTVYRWNKGLKADDGIKDRVRSGRPPKITFDIAQKVIAFYCQHHPLPGCDNWSVRWMAIYFQKHPEYLKVSISPSSVHRCLASNRLRLYRRKYFLQICDPFFFEKMEKIIQVYKTDSKNLFCLDECTGLQVLQRIAPDLPPESNRPEYQEFEYKRHGTVSILSILEKSTGKVFTEPIPDHKSTTVIASVKKHARQFDSSETLHYICDNLSSHSTEEFCQGIAELCRMQLPPLKTAHDRKQWLESPNKRIIFYFLPCHGSWLNLIEIWFSILRRKSLSRKSFTSITQMEKHILTFTETWNTHFAHSFKWNYDGKDLYEKVVFRFIKWLELETSQMTVAFLEKQLKLMNNLFTHYHSKIKLDTWNKLQKTLIAKKNYIYNIVTQSTFQKTKTLNSNAMIFNHLFGLN